MRANYCDLVVVTENVLYPLQKQTLLTTIAGGDVMPKHPLIAYCAVNRRASCTVRSMSRRYQGKARLQLKRGRHADPLPHGNVPE